MISKKNKTRRLVFLIYFLLVSVFLLGKIALATSSPSVVDTTFGLDYVEGTNPEMSDEEGIKLGAKDPRTIAVKIINVSLSVLGIIAVIIVIYGGFVWMTAEGNEDKISKARGILKSGVIGLIIILAAWGIVTLVFNKLGVSTGVSTGDHSTSTNNNIVPPGGPGSNCGSYYGNQCTPDNTDCNDGLVCNNNCICVPDETGTPCSGGDVCTSNNPECGSSFFCDSEADCTCQLLGYSNLNEPCSDGNTCNASSNTCNPHYGLSCDPDACICVGEPIITGISPQGGFCDNDINQACLNDTACDGGSCNISQANGALGNLITVYGYNFDYYDQDYSKVNLIKRDGEEEIIITAQVPSELNAACGNSWNNQQIVVAIPTSTALSVGDEIEIEVVTRLEKTDRSQDENGPLLESLLINNLERPGLCSVKKVGDDNTEGELEGQMNDELEYHGLNLINSKAYFGNSVSNILGLSPNNFSDNDIKGRARVPNLSTGKTSTFAKKEILPSNFMDFRKMAEAPQGPSISFFDPVEGSSGQYVTIYGSGFGSFKGMSAVYLVGDNQDSIEADYNFPPVCLQSVWSDDKILIKIPDNIDDGDYYLVLQIGTWNEIISSDTFKVSADIALGPSLCKISPSSGPHSTTLVNMWGEYFGTQARAVFSYQKFTDSVTPEIEGGADKIKVFVPAESISGPVKVERDNISGNSLNFLIGACLSDDDCSGSNTCCGANTVLAGSCVSDSNACNEGAPSNSLFKWSFDTGVADASPSFTGDELYSCASYTYCPETPYVCPNSPGVCSKYLGGQSVLISGTCDDTCQSICPDSIYRSDLNRCVKDIGNCHLDKKIEYSLGEGLGTTTKIAVCKNYDINGTRKSFFEISVSTSCPNGWSMISPGRCVNVPNVYSEEYSYTCGACPSGLSCQNLYGNVELGICASGPLCSGDYSCINGQCQKEDLGDCQCCCDKDQNSTDADSYGNPACCAPLICDYKCGVSANEPTNNENYGLCSGCKLSDSAGIFDRDNACNCLGTYGKFCEVSNIYPEGACLDCSAIQSETNCKGHGNSCCWDKKNGSCRGIKSDSIPWDEEDANWGYCPYYSCREDQPNLCNLSSPSSDSNDNYLYSSTSSCAIACQKNCNKYLTFDHCKNTDNCCWDEESNLCLGGTAFSDEANLGKCKYYQCSNPGSDSPCTVTDQSSDGDNPNYLKENICTLQCKNQSLGFGNYCASITPNYTNLNPVCDSNVCNLFSCLTSEGAVASNSTDCGVCCCNPNSSNDQCTQISSSLTCLPNKGLCTGSKRGLCCGCSTDASCVNPGLSPLFVGCGLDTCCRARPKIETNINKFAELDVLPEHEDHNVCRNAMIEINFDQRIDINSLSNNILLLEETSGACSPGTYFIGQSNFKKDTILARILKPILKIFKKDALAQIGGIPIDLPFLPISVLNMPSSVKNYCAVLGSVDFEHLSNNKTRVFFKPNNLLKAGTKYFVVVKGDVNLNSQSGIKSLHGIGMRGSGYYRITAPSTFSGWRSNVLFNNVRYPNSYIWRFITQSVNSPGEGICTIDHVEVSPDSYLFQTFENDLNENDEDSNHSSFDSVKDRDKVYVAKAYSSDHQRLQPTTGYSWTWDWNIDNQDVLNFYDVLGEESSITGFSLDGDKRLIGVKGGVTNGETWVSATTVLSSPYTTDGNNVSKSVPAYVMNCKNPWPAFNGETWSPWKDTPQSGIAGYNHEFYYCRDAGEDGTADDLPAFLSDLAIVKGNSLIKVCSNTPTQICENSNDCSNGGICLSSFLKETYFFKERIPHFIKNISASDNGMGGSIKLSWESDKSLVHRYKIYYNPVASNNNQEKIINPETECTVGGSKYACSIDINNLTNGQQYAFRVTALSENQAETNFSATVFATPTFGVLEAEGLNIPTNLVAQIESYDEKKVKLSWTAPTNYQVANYKVYRGTSQGVYASSFLTNSTETEIIVILPSGSGTKHYLAVSTIGVNSVESDKSNMVLVDFGALPLLP